MEGSTIAESRMEARRFVEPLGRRWSHVQAVGASALWVCKELRLNPDYLVPAGWLHDIGYADDLRDTGFHPVDGARYLRKVGWDERVVSLVAHHSCARYEVELRGLADFHEEFPAPPGEYEDALCYCDMTTGPAGAPVGAADRLDEIQQRYGPDSVVTRFVEAARTDILAAVGRVEAALSLSGSRAPGR